MKNINKTFVNGEVVNLKRGMFGYRVVHPHKNEDGTINWINLLIGGWENFWILIFIMLVILSFMYGVKEMMASCNDMAENPCKYFDLDFSRRIDDNFIMNSIRAGENNGALPKT